MQFEPEMIESISGMLGVRLNSKLVEEEEVEEEKINSQAKTTQTKFLIRPGREQDVITEGRGEKTTAGKNEGGRMGDEYTYEDYEREFLTGRSEAEMYAEDGRRVAEYQLLQAKWSTIPQL